jgi:Htaa
MLDSSYEPQRTAFPEKYSTGLAWTVKQSFIRYIAMLPDGAFSATDGASVAVESMFHFEVEDVGDRVVAFRGDVRFSGHGGLLFVGIIDPKITVVDGQAEMTIKLVRNGPETSEATSFAVGSLRLLAAEDDHEIYEATSVRLTEAGAQVFGPSYEAGTLLDNFQFRIRKQAGGPLL